MGTTLDYFGNSVGNPGDKCMAYYLVNFGVAKLGLDYFRNGDGVVDAGDKFMVRCLVNLGLANFWLDNFVLLVANPVITFL